MVTAFATGASSMTATHRLAFSLALVVLLIGGTARPAKAQVDLSGSWLARNHEDALERGAGPFLVDYLGIPLNDDGRAKALSLSPSLFSMIERECALWPPSYLVFGPFGLKMWNDTDPVSGNTTAWQIGAWEDRFGTTIWMDGRPAPSANALHERGGFTTGEWNGNILTTYTSQFKAGWIRRTGAPNSDQAAVTTHFIRHGDLLTVVAMIEDPIYFTETLTSSKNFQLDTANSQRPVGPVCVAGEEGTIEGRVPHYLPGKNPGIDDLMKAYHIPQDAALGGAETMYPEFRKKLKDRYVRPEKCVFACGGPPAPPAAPAPAAPPAPPR